MRTSNHKILNHPTIHFIHTQTVEPPLVNRPPLHNNRNISSQCCGRYYYSLSRGSAVYYIIIFSLKKTHTQRISTGTLNTKKAMLQIQDIEDGTIPDGIEKEKMVNHCKSHCI